MVTKCFRDPLIGIKIIKVAVCSPFEAAQIMESSATPHDGLVRSLEKKGHGLRKLNSKTDPDQASYLMWLGGNNESPIQYVMAIAELADWLGEEFRRTLLRQSETWPKEVEAYYKGQLFERAFRCLELPSVVFEKTEGEFTFPMTGEKILIKITSGDMIGKETHTSRRCAGKCGKNQEGNITIWLNKERWEDLRIFILFHEVIHVKQRILRKLEMEHLDLEEDTLYQVSPKLDAIITRQIFEEALKSLL